MKVLDLKYSIWEIEYQKEREREREREAKFTKCRIVHPFKGT
jgi:hypothetical protein